MTTDDSDLVDLIYEAAADPDLWIPVMETFADRIGGNSAFISGLDMRDGRGGVITARVDPIMPGRYFDYYALKNPLSNVSDLDAYLRDWKLGILTDEDWMPKDDLRASEYYNDFMLPQDSHGCMMIRLAARDTNIYALTINRSKRMGSFEAADLERAQRLYPHLLRAFRLGQQFADAQLFAGAVTETLDQAEHGVFVLEEGGRVRHMNGKAKALVAEPEGLRVSRGHLLAGRPDLTARLQALIAGATTTPAAGRRGGSMALATPGRDAPLFVTVTPLRSERLALFENRPCTVVVVTDLERGAKPPAESLRVLFNLTRSETRVAGLLFEGLSPAEAAERLSLSVYTIRGQIIRIFEKTGVHRQAELVRLMMRIVSSGFAS